MIDRENEIAYEESEAQELEGLRCVLNEVKQQNKMLIKEIEDYDTKINEVIEIAKLCDMPCSKQIIEILEGKKDE